MLPCPLQQVGHRKPHQIEDGLHVQGEHPLPGVEFGVLDGAEGDDSGGVHQMVQPAEATHGLLHHAGPEIRVRHVPGQGQRGAAGHLDFARHGSQALGTAGGDGDLRALGAKGQGGSPADPAGGSGHDGDLVLKALLIAIRHRVSPRGEAAHRCAAR